MFHVSCMVMLFVIGFGKFQINEVLQYARRSEQQRTCVFGSI